MTLLAWAFPFWAGLSACHCGSALALAFLRCTFQLTVFMGAK